MANKEERIAGIIRKSISEIITMELKNPHLGFVTIPEVKVSKDFSYAKVYVSFMFENEIEEERIYDNSVAWIMTDILKSAVEKGTGKPSSWQGAENDATIHFTPAKAGDDPENAEFRVGNEPGARLPSTGGMGTTPFTVAGGLLALLALALLLRRREAE